MRRLDPYRLLLAGLVSALVATGWATGCSEPPAGEPTDSGVVVADAAPPPETDGSVATDASQPAADAGAGLDASTEPADATSEPADAAIPGVDASEAPDAAAPGLDASVAVDAGLGVPLSGFGTISGSCGVLDVELTDGNAYYFENHLDFGTDPYDDPADLSQLTPGGQKLMTDPNAGGSSKASEAFSYEMLARCELASLLKTEMEIVYTVTGKITDMEVEMDASKIGVSVTRAMTYPETNPYPVSTAQALLEKKLLGIIDSTKNVSAQDKWVKQVLYIFAQTQTHADSMHAAWNNVAPATKADTIVFVTITDGADGFMYNNP
ncbi:MAG TPA: hypothetical protein VGK67_21920 [Myxococcales bacterium]|jgi:hypothetical protein